MTDGLFIEHAFKALIGVVVAVMGWLFNRSVKQNDEKMSHLSDRIETIEERNEDVIKLSVKMDMMMKALDKNNSTLDEVSKRVQGVELGVARLGVKSND